MLKAARLMAAIACLLPLAMQAAAAERIAFDSAARDTSFPQIFEGGLAYPDRIQGELQLPAKGAAPFPAIVIMHSSRGIIGTIRDWAKLFNELGLASFIVDSFGPRGLSEASAVRLTFPADTVDALRALAALRTDSRIDPEKIGVIGFSLGSAGAMNTSFERVRAAVLGRDGGKFAFHIVFYGGCP